MRTKTSFGDIGARVEALGSTHARASFRCGVEALDRYLLNQAGQDARKGVAAPFVLVLEDGTLAGYYTLSATGIKLTEFPNAVGSHLPRYPLVPATLLGRLAIDHRHHGRGFGADLLLDALFRSARSEIASFAVVVDAKDQAAQRFHEYQGFLPLSQPMRLFLVMSEIRKHFA